MFHDRRIRGVAGVAVVRVRAGVGVLQRMRNDQFQQHVARREHLPLMGEQAARGRTIEEQDLHDYLQDLLPDEVIPKEFTSELIKYIGKGFVSASYIGRFIILSNQIADANFKRLLVDNKAIAGKFLYKCMGANIHLLETLKLMCREGGETKQLITEYIAKLPAAASARAAAADAKHTATSGAVPPPAVTGLAATAAGTLPHAAAPAPTTVAAPDVKHAPVVATASAAAGAASGAKQDSLTNEQFVAKIKANLLAGATLKIDKMMNNVVAELEKEGSLLTRSVITELFSNLKIDFKPKKDPSPTAANQSGYSSAALLNAAGGPISNKPPLADQQIPISPTSILFDPNLQTNKFVLK